MSGRAQSRNAIKLLEVIGFTQDITQKSQEMAECFIKTGKMGGSICSLKYSQMELETRKARRLWHCAPVYEDSKGELHEREYSAGYKKTTNNRMELMAVITGLEALTRPCGG